MAAKKRARKKAARKPVKKAARRGKPIRAKRRAPKSRPKRGAKKSAPKPRAKKSASKPRAAAPAGVPNGIGFVSHHLDYTTHAFEEVRQFYTVVLGFSRARVDEPSYLLVTTGASSSLGFMPPVPGPPEDWRPPREPVLYFLVRDVDKVHRDLAAKGVEFQQPPTDMYWGHRVASLKDPEGRLVMLAQTKGS